MLNQEQLNAIQTIIDNFSTVRGNRLPTMLEGIVDAIGYLGATINMFSHNDVILLDHFFKDNVDLSPTRLIAMNNFIKSQTGENLECIQVLKILANVESSEIDIGKLCEYLGAVLDSKNTLELEYHA